MAIKTRAELETQSDNTFLDNTTGQIIPSNHRSWNDDVLEAMFTGIAGRSVTEAEFDDLVTNSELVEGCVYRITSIIDNCYGTSDIVVSAKTSNSLNEFGILVGNDGFEQIGIFINNSNPISYQKTNEIIDGNLSLPSILFINNINEFLWNQNHSVTVNNSTKFKAIDNFKNSIGGNSANPINNNLFAHRTIGQGLNGQFAPYVSGFFPPPYNNPNNICDFYNFYEDHGSESNWGNANANNGTLGSLTLNNASNVSNVALLNANFQKVNSNIFGMVFFEADLNFGGSAPFIEFDLPYIGYSNNWENTIIGHGQAFDNGSNHTIFVQVFNVGIVQSAKATFRLIGNHSGNINASICFSFSYSLDPS